MPKIKVVQFIIQEGENRDTHILVDDKGRVWIDHYREWEQYTDLPEEPEEEEIKIKSTKYGS